jgi:hypothetical protein
MGVIAQEICADYRSQFFPEWSSLADGPVGEINLFPPNSAARLNGCFMSRPAARPK